jgi:hypothetical protein
MHSVRALCLKNVHSLYVQKVWGGAYIWRVSSGRQRSASNVVVLLGLTSAIWPSLFVISNSISSQATSKLLPKFLNGALKHSGPNEATMGTWNTGTAKQVVLSLEGIRYLYEAHSLSYRVTFFQLNIQICVSKVSVRHPQVGCSNWKFCISSISLESNFETEVPLTLSWPAGPTCPTYIESFQVR